MRGVEAYKEDREDVEFGIAPARRRACQAGCDRQSL